MRRFSDYIIYVDESGDHSLEKIEGLPSLRARVLHLPEGRFRGIHSAAHPGVQVPLVRARFDRSARTGNPPAEGSVRRICDGSNFRGEAIDGLRLVFADKRTNSSGLQLADLTARPIGLHVLRPGQPNRAFDIIETKLRRNPEGEYHGWGLKVFP